MPRKKEIPRARPRRRAAASAKKAEVVEGWLEEKDAPDPQRGRGRPKSTVARKAVTVYIPAPLHKDGKRRALDEERTFSDLVVEAISAYLKG